ncbi:hypothetical protein TNCV_855571 [Trichonephila clavipes]|nr:hypothetical protein TNCV_855571 [Trichonephila clavipes]
MCKDSSAHDSFEAEASIPSTVIDINTANGEMTGKKSFPHASLHDSSVNKGQMLYNGKIQIKTTSDGWTNAGAQSAA